MLSTRFRKKKMSTSHKCVLGKSRKVNIVLTVFFYIMRYRKSRIKTESLRYLCQAEDVF